MHLKTILLLAVISGQAFGQQPSKSELVALNGIDMYYEVYGEGEPLLLLHGWTQSSSFWHEYIPAFAKNYQVYAIDLRGHGRSSPLTEDFSITKTSRDLLALVDSLELKKVKAIGLSYGGLVLLQLAALHPEKVTAMIVIGTSPRYDGAEDTDLDVGFAYKDVPPAYLQELKRIHHHGDGQIRALFDKNLNYRINLSDDDIKRITSGVLIIQGDRDEILGIDPAISLFRNLPDAELWIVPNTGHIAITRPNLDLFIAKSMQFFAADNKEGAINSDKK